MAPEPTGTASAQRETGKNGPIERARKAAGEWHCVPGYEWALRFLPPGANRGGERFEIRRAEAGPENEYPAISVHAGPARPRRFAGRGGSAWRPVGGRAPRRRTGAGGRGRAFAARERPPPPGWRRFASAFERLAPDFFGPYPELGKRERFACSFAGSAAFFGMLALIILARLPELLDRGVFRGTGPGEDSPVATVGIVFVLPGFSLLTLFFAFICSRRSRRHSPVRVYLFAYLLPLAIWISASQIGVSGMFSLWQDTGGGP